VTGLVSGILISIPAMMNGEFLTMPLYAGVGVLGGVLRDLAPEPEEIWRFSPLPELKLYLNPRRQGFQLFFLLTILFAEFLRWSALRVWEPNFLFAPYRNSDTQPLAAFAIFATTVFAT